MAEKGSRDANLHVSQGKKIAALQKNLDNTMAVVMRHDAEIKELARDAKVAKSVWMNQEAQR